MAALTVDFGKHSGPTPADDMAAQIITDWKLHTASNMDSVPLHKIASPFPEDVWTFSPYSIFFLIYL